MKDGLFNSPPLHDYPWAASYLLRQMSNLTNTGVELFSWWTFSDLFEEQGFQSQEFDTYTGWGLMSRSGIAKPTYRVFQLMHNSGDMRREISIGGRADDFGSLGNVFLVLPFSFFFFFFLHFHFSSLGRSR
jgi:hypothetical protein